MEIEEARRQILDVCSYAQLELRNAPGVHTNLSYTSTWFNLQVRIRHATQELQVDVNLISLDIAVDLGGIAIELWRQTSQFGDEERVETITLFPRESHGQPGLPCVGGFTIFEWDRRINEIAGHYRLRPTTNAGVWLIG